MLFPTRHQIRSIFGQMAKILVCGAKPSCLIPRLTLPDWGLNSDRIRNIFDKNAQKLDFSPIRSVETQEHILACVACSFLTYSGDALREMFMQILFPRNTVTVFQKL